MLGWTILLYLLLYYSINVWFVIFTELLLWSEFIHRKISIILFLDWLDWILSQVLSQPNTNLSVSIPFHQCNKQLRKHLDFISIDPEDVVIHCKWFQSVKSSMALSDNENHDHLFLSIIFCQFHHESRDLRKWAFTRLVLSVTAMKDSLIYS